MARWSLRLLGPFVAERDGASLPGFRSDKVRALLAFLAVQVDRPWTRATLADLLWPDQVDATARSNLRNALSNLRHVLGDRLAEPPFLHLTPSIVQANGAAERWVDVDVFSKQSTAARDERDPEIDPDVVPRLEEALRIYRGPFLEGFAVESAPFESWLESTREGLHRQAVAVARALAFTHARLGDAEAATAASRRWLELEPWEDEAQRHLMRLLVLQDHRTEALAQYETFRSRLAQDLGVEPEAETMRQYAAIRAERTSPVKGAAPAVVWPGLPHGPLAPEVGRVFVAREEELRRLFSTLERTLEGHGGVAFAVGEPGSGKTALLAEFARRALAAHPGLIVLWGQANAFTGSGDPFEPFRQIARMLSGEAEAPPAAAASRAEGAVRLWRTLPATLDALLEHGPDLIDTFVSGGSLLDFARRHVGVSSDRLSALERRLERSPPASGRPGPGHQAVLIEHFCDVVRALADERPVVLILDDLQWIDPGSSDLLFHLARGLAGHRVLLLGAYRAEEAAGRREDQTHSLADALEEFMAAEGSVRIDLTHAAGAPFVDALLDTEPNALGLAFRGHVYARTSGNPLFTLELLRGMQLRGDLQRDRQGRWVEGPTLRWDDVPSRVEAVIERRISHVSPACLELLTAAAVEGEQFTAEVAAAATDQPLAQACERLSEEAGRRHALVAAHTVQSVGDASVALYRFRHGLFQTYLHRRLDPVQRAHLHGRVGHELQRLYRPDPVRYREQAIALAHHFEAAGLAADAVDAHVHAARHALGLSAYEEAVDHLHRGLALLRTLPASKDRDRQEFDMQLALGPPLTAIRGWSPPELAATYARVEALSAGIDDPERLVPALWLLAVFHLGRSEHDAVHRSLARMASLAARSGDRALITLANLNVGAFYQGRFTQARPLLEAACHEPDLEVQRQLASQFGMAPAVVALAYLAECLWFLGHPDEAEQRRREARAWTERIDHPMTSCYAFGRANCLAAVRGDAEALHSSARELRAVAERHGLGYFASAATLFAHRAAVRLGGTLADLDAMQAANDQCAATGTTLNQGTFLAHYAEACGELGEVGRGLAVVDAALAEGNRSGELLFQAEAWRIKGTLLRMRAAQGKDPAHDLAAARACFETAMGTAREQGAVAIERRAAEELAKV